MFIVSTISPLVIGYEADAELDIVGEDEYLLHNLAYSCYDVFDRNSKYKHYKEQILGEVPDNDINVFESGLKPVKPSSVISSGDLMNSSWPMLNHDVRHMGRSPYSTENVTGLEKWRHCNYRTGWGGLEGGPIIDKDGIIYYGDMDRYVYAVYPNGTRKWKTYLNSPIRMTPAIDENGILYIGTIWEYPANYFYAIDSKDGSIKWKYRIGGNIDSCPAIGGDGTIYFGDWDGWINALNPNF